MSTPLTPYVPKKVQAHQLLLGPDAPRVFSPGTLMEWLEQKNCPLPRRSLTQALIEWNATKVVSKINAHVYLNPNCFPKPRPDEAASWLRPQAVVSGARVLGDAGVLNNPVHTITCVMPIGSSRKSGKVKLGDHSFVFAALPDALCSTLSQDNVEDLFSPDVPYMRATPEKALVDWMYLNSTSAGRASHPLPPAGDWDWDMIDLPKLARLIDRFGLKKEWTRVKESLGAPDFSSNAHSSPTLSTRTLAA